MFYVYHYFIYLKKGNIKSSVFLIITQRIYLINVDFGNENVVVDVVFTTDACFCTLQQTRSEAAEWVKGAIHTVRLLSVGRSATCRGPNCICSVSCQLGTLFSF